MRLYIMRHGHAVLPLSTQSDEERRLTPEGEQEVVTTATWLSQKAGQLDSCLVSPYIRAQQTATVAMGCIKANSRNDVRELTPDTDPGKALTAVAAEIEAHNYQQLLLVSHMPLVSYLVNEIDRSKQPPIFPTGGIAVMEFDPQTLRGTFEQLMVAERCVV
ncbi:MAG: phosphohistidine phosphatase SixA [Pseudomonadota bacterium]